MPAPAISFRLRCHYILPPLPPALIAAAAFIFRHVFIALHADAFLRLRPPPLMLPAMPLYAAAFRCRRVAIFRVATPLFRLLPCRHCCPRAELCRACRCLRIFAVLFSAGAAMPCCFRRAMPPPRCLRAATPRRRHAAIIAFVIAPFTPRLFMLCCILMPLSPHIAACPAHARAYAAAFRRF